MIQDEFTGLFYDPAAITNNLNDRISKKMTIEHYKIKAKNVPVDTYVYIQGDGVFFHVDDKDILDDTAVFYFEVGIDETGLIEFEMEFDSEEVLTIIDPYKVIEVHT